MQEKRPFSPEDCSRSQLPWRDKKGGISLGKYSAPGFSGKTQPFFPIGVEGGLREVSRKQGCVNPDPVQADLSEGHRNAVV